MFSTPIIGWFSPLLALCCTWLSLRILLRTRLVRATKDEANERSLHKGSIPRIGGLGIAIGVLIAAFAIVPKSALIWVLLASFWSLVAVSLLDDIYRLPVLPRLVVQLLCAAASLYGLYLYGLNLSAAALLATVPILVWSTNLFNFMDGSDGLAGGMTVIGFATYALLAAAAAQVELALFCAVVAAAALAFLWFNFYPAKLFMGDAGSVPIGFTAGLVGCAGWHLACWTWWLPIVLFFPFVFDATYTLIRRALRGAPLWRAHREHLYQRFILAGMGHRQLALRAYGLMLLCALISLCSANATFGVGGLIIGVQMLLGLYFARRLAN